ncbi:MAG: helix-turn-helix domain-containing protein, partial [Bifidobacteriaceae bacterium]|nr:helix-turn-helix domain-containing protein [Bifidobacteriaceae bacterium]
MPAHYKHLSLDERVQIEKHIDQGWPVRRIARALGRSVRCVGSSSPLNPVWFRVESAVSGVVRCRPKPLTWGFVLAVGPGGARFEGFGGKPNRNGRIRWV